jgi:subtilisin family serine protease
MPNSANGHEYSGFSADLLSIIDGYRPLVYRGGGGFALPTESDRIGQAIRPSLNPVLLVTETLRHQQMVLATVRKKPGEDIRVLADNLLAGELSQATLAEVPRSGHIVRAELMKRQMKLLNSALPTIGLPFPVENGTLGNIDGRGVLVGIIDSGFDLSHPCFRDGRGRLRVDALLDQSLGPTFADWKEWSADQLESTIPPFGQDDVHGTHVASIAAGSPFCGLRGVAPGSRFLLVKTDFIHTADAMQWIFKQAEGFGRPCVINCSFGHHDGAHDGTDIEETDSPRALTGPGRILVAAAGNSGDTHIHVQCVMEPGACREIPFCINGDLEPPGIKLSCWYSIDDSFDVRLISPWGTTFRCPENQPLEHQSGGAIITLSRTQSLVNGSVEVALEVVYPEPPSQDKHFKGWRLSLNAEPAVSSGLIDVWITNDDEGEFVDSEWIVSDSTITMPATSSFCIAVGSAVNRANPAAGSRPSISSFSGRGPTRDRRQKPDLVAPGDPVTAALARSGEGHVCSDWVSLADRSVALGGTSQASPFITGAIALMLQIKSSLTVDQAGDTLRRTARKRGCSCTQGWCKVCGFGMINVLGALKELSSHSFCGASDSKG